MLDKDRTNFGFRSGGLHLRLVHVRAFAYFFLAFFAGFFAAFFCCCCFLPGLLRRGVDCCDDLGAMGEPRPVQASQPGPAEKAPLLPW